MKQKHDAILAVALVNQMPKWQNFSIQFWVIPYYPRRNRFSKLVDKINPQFSTNLYPTPFRVLMYLSPIFSRSFRM